jgi:hypothetical protein
MVAASSNQGTAGLGGPLARPSLPTQRWPNEKGGWSFAPTRPSVDVFVSGP